MPTTTIKAGMYDFTFNDTDVCNPDDCIFAGDYNPHNVRGWLFHDHGFTLCVVFAESLQNALDIACDENRLNRYMIDSPHNTPGETAGNDWRDYMTDDPSECAAGFDVNCPERIEPDGTRYWWRIEPAFLGNASEPHDIDTLGYVEFAIPAQSICRSIGERVTAISAFCA